MPILFFRWTAAIGLPCNDKRDTHRNYRNHSQAASASTAGFVFTWGVGRNGQLGQGPDQVSTSPI